MRKLYINGQVADIDEGTKVSISYKSPLFSDITTVTANSTTTIKLPRTARNSRLIDNVNIVGVLSNFAYDYFKVDYIDGGFNVISAGKGFLLGLSEETIEMSVTFGASTQRFALMKDVKLTEMPVPLEQSKVQWQGATWTPAGQTPGVRWIDMQYSGISAKETDFRYVHPCVSVRQVIDWIQTAYGVQLWMFDGALNNWVLPCVTKNRRKGETGAKVDTDSSSMGMPILTFVLFGALTNQEFKFENDAEMNFKIEHLCRLAGSGQEVWRSAKDIKVIEICDDGSTVAHGHDGEKEPLGSEISVKVDKTSKYNVYHRVYQGAPFVEHLISTKLTITPPKEELMYGWDAFDVVPNLPDIKVLDFIKAVAGMMAWFPVPDKETPERVQFQSFKALYNEPAKDWSDKLLEVKSIDYKYGDFAQVNTLNWAEDDVVSVKDVGVIRVENRTLAASKKLVELPLAACDECGWVDGRASLKIYEKTHDRVLNSKNEYISVLTGAKLNKIKPRIVYDTITAPRIGKVIRIAGENGLIAQNYELYKGVMRKPMVIKAVMMLTPGDLAQLDFMKPVFVEQLHGVFALMAVSVKDGGCEVEMLRLT